MSELIDEQARLEQTRRLAPPDPDREPLKVNVYERMAQAAAELMPLFPYDHPGAIVPCGNVLIGGPDKAYGHFFHWNSMDEVTVVYGSKGCLLNTGQIMANQNLHGVNSFLRDEKDPEAFSVIVVTQRQTEEGDQKETMIARCKKCKAEIVRHDYDSTPYGLDGYNPERHGREEDRVRQFPIALGSVEFADIRNTERGRTCAACGYVNDPFPTALWGWEREVAQIRAVNAAHRELAQAAPSPAASSATGTGAQR